MVCVQGRGGEGGRLGGRRRERREVMEQYRRLRLVLPTISRRGKISKVKSNMDICKICFTL